MARRFSSGQRLAQSDALSDKDLKIFPAAPVICDRTPQRVFSVQSGPGGNGDALLLQLDQQFLIQGIESIIIQSGMPKAETHHIQWDWGQ